MNKAADEEDKGLKNLENEIEDIINGTELLKGDIEFGEVEWEAGTASVTVSTKTEYKIEWQKNNNIEGNWSEITNGGKITGLSNNDIVFARLTDGQKVGAEATIKIEDKKGPDIILDGSSTSSTITINAEANDKETGLEEPPIYIFYYKETSQSDEDYKEIQRDSKSDCNITNLKQGTSYTIKVEIKDKAGNIGSASKEVITETVTSGTVEGAIVFSQATWSNGKASITISTNTNYQIEWQKGDIIEGNWTSGTEVTDLNNNDIIFARLTDGINAGKEASAKVEDKILPTISSFVVTNIDKTFITVTTTASDAETGIEKYEYKKGNEPFVDGSGNTYTFNGLTPSTTYTFTVKVTDKAGNSIETTVSGTTKSNVPNVGDIDNIVNGNTDAEDDLGNKVKIPDGFKVVEGTKVEEGIVIEDRDGNQFVWVPVGPIKKSDGSTVTITLGRYTFDSSGAPSSPYSANQSINGAYIEINGSGSKGTTSYKNVGPININDFISKANSSHGYYIARYEASYRSGSLNGANIDTFVPYSKVSRNTNGDQYDRADGDLFRYVSQSSAAYACRNMYKGNSYFTSDLTNSFAWDTALVFIRNCSGNTRYPAQSISVKTLKNTGTTTDQVCHIYDMCGNLKEWTTETSTSIDQNNVNYSCVPRGDSYAQGGSNNSTSKRVGARTSADDFNYGFRPILYL